VKKALMYRLFRAGRMPPQLRELAARGALVSDEGVSIKVAARSLRAPGRYVSRGVSLRVGAIVMTADRVAMSIGKHLVLDASYAPSGDGPVTCSTDAEGIHIHLDVVAAGAGTSGTVDFTVRTPVDGLPVVGTRALALSPVEAAALVRWT
jgi:hypothetical protein